MQDYLNDAMIDLESMGVGNSPALIQISAVQFDMFTGETGETFNEVIDLKSSMDAGLNISPGTIKFWMTNTTVSQEARELVMAETGDHTDGTNSLEDVLGRFSKWIEENDIQYVHGNGSASDNVWLRSSYEACNIKAPFTFRDDMCYRTLRTFAKRLGWVEEIEFEGIVHNGIDDAKHQIRVLKDILNFLNNSDMTEQY